MRPSRCSRTQAVRDDAREVAEDPAAGHVREGPRAVPQAADVVQVQPRWREQVVAAVVLVREHATDEREAVRVDAGRAQARRSRRPPRRASRPRASSRSTTPTQVPAKSSSPSAYTPGSSAVSPPTSATPAARQTSAAPSTSSATCSSSICAGGDVVEQHQRLCAGRDHVVDAVRREVGAAGPERPPLACKHQLRADPVGRGHEQPVARPAGACPAKAPNPVRPRRLDGSAQPLDDGAAGGDGDTGGRVRGARPAHGTSLRADAVVTGRARRAAPGVLAARPRRSGRSCR